MPARRTSNTMKVLKGTSRPDRMRDEPDYAKPDGYPDPPDWLQGPVAAQEWKARVKDLVDAGVVAESGLATLGHYCNLHADMVKRWRIGDKPTAAELTQFRMLATEFGFTPASRSKAGGGTTKKENPFASIGRKAG